MKSPKDNRTPDMFEVHSTWFLMLNALVHDGTLARLQKECSACLAVYVVLRGACDYDSGLCSIGTELLAEKAGCSVPTAKKAIRTLEAEKLLEIISSGRGKRNVYRLYDRLDVKKQGEGVGDLLVPYKPRNVSERVEDIRVFKKEGEMPARSLAAGVNVNITINVNKTEVNSAENVYTFTDSTSTGLEQLEKMKDGPYKLLALRKLKEQVEAMEKSVEAERAIEESIDILRLRDNLNEDCNTDMISASSQPPPKKDLPN